MVQSCYKTKNPIFYNKGTRYESTCSEFMMWLGNEQTAPAIVEELNANRPEVYHGTKIDWNKIDYFYVSEPIDPDTFY